MARDLSVQQPPDPQSHPGPAGPEHGQDQGQGCARLETAGSELDTSSESEGDGGGYRDQSYELVGEGVSEWDGLQGEGEQGEHLYRQFLARRRAIVRAVRSDRRISNMRPVVHICLMGRM